MKPELAPYTDLSPRRRYLVGVSGGRDSTVLLDWLLAGGVRKLVVCHLNHGLRGRDSGADATFVRRLAKRHGLDCEVKKTRIGELARARGMSLEAAGRAARHEFFVDVARRHRCHRVLLGHHTDDQVETVLINLFRGSGTLNGMRPRSEITVCGRKLELLRPLLGVWQKEIVTYATEHRIAYREDASNATGQFLRNRVRNRLIPGLLEIFQRDVRKGIARATELAGAESELLDSLLDEFGTGAELNVAELRAAHPALQRRAIHRWLRAGDVPNIGFAEVERVRAMLDDDALAKVNLPAGRHARRRRGVLFLQPANARG